MPPSRPCRRCLVFLLLVAAGTGFPGTQRDLGVSDAFDPRQNVDAGVAYLRRLTDEFGTVLALAAYNAGPGAVRRYNGIPPYEQTHAYVRAVLSRGQRAADVQAPEEQNPSADRARAGAEADHAEGAPVALRLQDDHPAADGAAGLGPRALDEETEPGSAADTVRFVLYRGADRLTVGVEPDHDPERPVVAAIQASDLLGGLVGKGDEGDRLGRRAEASDGVARARHHRPGLAGPCAGGDHRPVFEARSGPALVEVEGRQQRVGGGDGLRAPVPPNPFHRGKAARGEPDPERGHRFGEPPPGPETVRASGPGADGRFVAERPLFMGRTSLT